MDHNSNEIIIVDRPLQYASHASFGPCTFISLEDKNMRNFEVRRIVTIRISTHVIININKNR